MGLTVEVDVGDEVRLSDACACAICRQATHVCHTEPVAGQLQPQRASVTKGARRTACWLP